MAAEASEVVKREADKKEVAVSISLIGKQAYSTLKDLSLPDFPAQKTYDQLREILKGYYKPKVFKVAETSASITPSRMKTKPLLSMQTN